jgi:hypothetical protein
MEVGNITLQRLEVAVEILLLWRDAEVVWL